MQGRPFDGQKEQSEEEPMLNGIRGLLFDLDGTLVDSMWMWKQIDIDFLGGLKEDTNLKIDYYEDKGNDYDVMYNLSHKARIYKLILINPQATQ